MSVLTCVIESMGSSCSRPHSLNEAEAAENARIKLIFQTGFDEGELRSYTSVIHANVYQTIKEIGEKLSEIGAKLDYPLLNKELVQDVRKLWQDPAIQETYSRGSILQVPDCARYFMSNLDRLAEVDYVPPKEDMLYARVQTNGAVEVQFSPLGESKIGGEVYRLYDVGGQRNDRRKWIHLFEVLML
uniref:Uncharacterized protein n=1 Tax=Setaria italica TaxID=4555 RepID=K4AIF8_SETIT